MPWRIGSSVASKRSINASNFSCRSVTSSVPGSSVAATSAIVLDVLSDHLLLLLDFVQAALDASGQPAELLLREPPFFSSKFRWIDSWTSFNASAIRNPGGCSGPP